LQCHGTEGRVLGKKDAPLVNTRRGRVFIYRVVITYDKGKKRGLTSDHYMVKICPFRKRKNYNSTVEK